MNVELNIQKVSNGFIVKQGDKTFVHCKPEDILERINEALEANFMGMKKGDNYVLKIETLKDR